MIEESLLKSNYIGKDGFIWWIGQVAHPDSWRNEKSDLSDKDRDSKWAFRCKVRIIGYHTFDGSVLPDDDLPWAHIMLDPAFGSGQGGLGTRHNIVGGETVFGFFLDGDDAQQPVVVGLIYRTNQTENLISEAAVRADKSSAFKPFRGDSGHMTMKPIQRRELPKKEIATPQQSTTPKNIVGIAFSSPSLLGTTGEERPPGRDQIVTNDSAFQSAWKSAYTYAKTSGENGCENNVIGKITRALNDFIAVINGLQKTVNGFIDPITNAVIDITNFIRNTTTKILGLIKSIVNNMRSTVIKLITKLFREFIALILPIPQHQPVAEATKNIIDIIFCLFERLLDLLGPFLENMLNGLIGNSLGAAQCAAEQFVAALISKILDFIDDLLAPVMSGISWLTGGISQLSSILSQATSVANQILNFIGCDNLKCKSPSEWSMAFGMSGAVPDNWGKVFGNLDILDSIGSNIDDVVGYLSIYGSGSGYFGSCNTVTSTSSQSSIPPAPYGTQYSFCIPPEVSIYGGGGTSAQAVPIVSTDGRIIAIEVLNGGFGYTSPPTVNIVDNTGHGSGATAGAVIENGSISGFYITNNGSGYCQGNYTDLQSDPYYITTANQYSILEGQSVTFTITGYNAPQNPGLTYQITGDVGSSDIRQSLTGNISFSNGIGKITIDTIRDDINDGIETMIFDVFDSSNSNVSRVYIIVSDSNATILPPNNNQIQSPAGNDVPDGEFQDDNSIVGVTTTSIVSTGQTSGVTLVGIVTTVSGIVTTSSGLTTSITNLTVITGVTTGIGTTSFVGLNTSPITGISSIFQAQLEIQQGITTSTQQRADTGITTVGIGNTFVTIPLSIGIGTSPAVGVQTTPGTSTISGLSTTSSVPLSGTPLVEVDRMVVVSPGNRYISTDTINVGAGVTFRLITDPISGSVVGTELLDGVQYFTTPPQIQINTEDGEGALIYPVFRLRKQYNVRPLVINQGGVLEVIDCV